MKKALFVVALFSAVCILPVQAQNFKSKLILGANFCQITGDSMAGFNKVGLYGGMGLSKSLGKKLNVCFEIVYSRKGSRSANDTTGLKPIRIFTLTYIDIPIYIQYEFYPKISVEGGFSYGILNKATFGDGNIVRDQTDTYYKSDIESLIGVEYNFNDKFAFNARVSNSVLGINKFSDPSKGVGTLLNVVTTLSMRYLF